MKLDLHIHSCHSRDASASPIEIVRKCKSLGLGGLAITDHNELKGSLEAFAVAREEGVLVVRGVEVSAVEGHVLALGVANPIARGMAISETVAKIRAEGGVAIAAHPDRYPSGIGVKAAKDLEFDAIEVLNGGSSRRANARARVAAEWKKIAVIGGSDAHGIDQVGKAWTVVDDASSEDDVIQAIRKGQCSVGGRSRTVGEGVRYSLETFVEWLRGDMRRL